MKNNTVVTAGDRNYLWGVYLLIASMRKNGMDEPVVVLGVDYGPDVEKLLKQFGDVKVFSIPRPARSLACHKPDAMLLAETEFITWVDCDAFFLGNNSANLPPLSPDEIHIRMRGEAENAMAFAEHRFGEDGKTIPAPVLEEWRQDIGSNSAPATPRACSDCLLSVHRSHLLLIKKWQEQMHQILPEKNIGVVDRTLLYYHQLDESVLNSLLCLWPGAPRVSKEYRLDKKKDELYIHFVCHPKPWAGWTTSSFRHFDRYLDVVAFCEEQGFDLPGPLPFSLQRKNKTACRVLRHFITLKTRLARRWGRLFK